MVMTDAEFAADADDYGYSPEEYRRILNREQQREAQRRTSGFKPERKRYRLRFKGDYEGLVVEMRGISVGLFMELAELADIDPTRFSVEQMPQVKRLFSVVAESLHSWNLLDDDDQPVPATAEGVMSQDFPMILAVVDGWMRAIGEVPAPLAQPSADGGPSAALSLPMEVSSPSL